MDKEGYNFPKNIRSKVNKLKFNVAYYDVAVQHFSHGYNGNSFHNSGLKSNKAKLSKKLAIIFIFIFLKCVIIFKSH